MKNILNIIAELSHLVQPVSISSIDILPIDQIVLQLDLATTLLKLEQIATWEGKLSFQCSPFHRGDSEVIAPLEKVTVLSTDLAQIYFCLGHRYN